MKQFKLIMPEGTALDFAAYCYTNAIRVLLSYSKDEFFSVQVVILVAMEEEKTTEFLTKYKAFVK
jgi:hypothetical protein